MTVKDRLKEFIKHKGIPVRKFEETIGVSHSYVSNIRVSIQPDKMISIAKCYPELNTEWLLTGKGEMLREDDSSRGSSEPPSQMQYFYDKLDEKDEEIKRLNEELIQKEEHNGRLKAYISRLEVLLDTSGIDYKQSVS